MSGSIYDPQRLLIVKRKKEGRKREEQGGEMLNQLQAENTRILKGIIGRAMLKSDQKSEMFMIKTQFP